MSVEVRRGSGSDVGSSSSRARVRADWCKNSGLLSSRRLSVEPFGRVLKRPPFYGVRSFRTFKCVDCRKLVEKMLPSGSSMSLGGLDFKSDPLKFQENHYRQKRRTPHAREAFSTWLNPICSAGNVDDMNAVSSP